MIKTRFGLRLCISAIAVMSVTHPQRAYSEQTSSPRRLKSNDKQIREFAITSPTPAYPAVSLAKKVTGVVIAEIRTDTKGAPERVEILQSPDPDTGRAVQDAVMRWRFKPMGMGMEGKVAFYFRLEGSRGLVLSPAEMRKRTNPDAKALSRAEEPAAKSITETEFRALSSRLRLLVLDTRDRQTFAEGHETGAVNMPFGEILTRAAAELRVSQPIIIDCRDPPDVCALVAHQLISSGFTDVSILHR